MQKWMEYPKKQTNKPTKQNKNKEKKQPKKTPTKTPRSITYVKSCVFIFFDTYSL